MKQQQMIEYTVVGLIALVIIATGIANIQGINVLSQQFSALESYGVTTCDGPETSQCRLAVAEWGRSAVDWLDANLGVVFSAITLVVTNVLAVISYIFTGLPASLIIILLGALGYIFGGRWTGGFVLGALLFVAAMGYFNDTMITLSLVATATILALIIGIPVGIAKAHSRVLTHLIDPVLDFMQTMPLFVYLIPAVLFFSIGDVPGIVATFIFATPPAVRLTALGIEQIPTEFIEAGHAFGATPLQFLQKIEIPLALPSIMAGVNQTIMLALSMVVVASMVGASGLGRVVYTSITQLNAGQGIASGIGIVLLAMILDRLTRTVWRR